MATCKMVHLDEFGKPSAFYDRMVEKHGPVKGEEMYIRHMIGMSATQFSNPVLDIQAAKEELFDVANRMKDPSGKDDPLKPNGNKYFDPKKRKYYNRTTNWITSFGMSIKNPITGATETKKIDEFDRQAISLKYSQKLIKEKIAKDSNVDMTVEEIQDEYDRMNKKYPKHLKETQQDVLNQWKAKEEYGTFIHGVLEHAFIIRDELIEFNDKHSNPSDKVDAGAFTLAMKGFRKMKELDPDHADVDVDSFIQVVTSVLDKAEELEKQHKKKFKIIPELKLRSEFLGDQHDPGLAGSADLVFMSEDGDVFIGDFKTKDEKHLKNFDRITNDTLGGPFGNLTRSPKDKATAQMTVYAAMLKEMGFNVLGGSAFVVVARLSKKVESLDAAPGEVQYRYSKINRVDEHVVTLKTAALEAFGFNKDIETHLVKMRGEGSYGTADTLSNGKVKYMRDNKAGFIRNYRGRVYPDANGRLKLPDDFAEKHYDVTNMTEEQIEKVISNIFEEAQKRQTKLASNVVEYYRSGDKSGFSVSVREHIDALLLGFDPEKQDLHVAQDFHTAFQDVGPDVLVMVDRNTQDISMLSVISSTNSQISFDNNGKKSRTSIYGNYMTDEQLINDGFPQGIKDNAYIHDFINQKLAIAAINYKQAKGGDIGVKTIKTASILSKTMGSVTASSMEIELGVLKHFLNIPKAKAEMPVKIVKLLTENPDSLTDPRSYKEDIISNIINVMDQELSSKRFNKKQTAELQEAIDMYTNSHDTINNLIAKLSTYYRGYINTVGIHYATDDNFKILNDALLTLLDIDLASKQVREESFAGSTNARSPITAGDYYTQKLYTLYNSAVIRIQQEMKVIKKENEKRFSALLKYKGVSRQSGSEGLKAAFSNMYVDFNMKNDKDKSRWMRLKDSTDSSLHATEKAYIEFFNEHVLKAMKRSAGSSKGVGETGESSTWANGLVPIFSETTDILDRKAYKSLKNFGKAFNVKTKDKANDKTAAAFKFEYSSGLELQKGDVGMQHSKYRRSMLGIDASEDNDTGSPIADMEKNLATIVMHTALAGAQQEHMQILADAYTGMDALLLARKQGEYLDTTDSSKLLEMTAEMIIHNRYKKEGKMADTADKIKKYASNFMFTMSTKQAMLELTTQAVNSTSATIANIIRQAATGDGRFGVGDMLWANKALLYKLDGETSVKVDTIISDHNMIIGDPENFKSNDYAEIKKHHLYKGKVMRGMNTVPFNFGIKKIVLAQMRKMGIMDAYENIGTKTEPEFVYNENLDPRFHVYDDSKPKSSKNKPPKTDIEQKKHASWKFARQKMLKEGILDDNGRMTMPLFAEQRVDMKQYATKLFGSFGKDGMIMAQFSSTGRALSTYKGWFAQKLANYYTKSHISEAYGEEQFHENEDGTYEVQWTGREVEGIIQSTNKLLKEIEYYKVLQLRNVKLTPIQRENFSKLLADAILLMFTYLAIWPLLEKDNKIMNSKFGETMKKSVMNATGELNIFATTNSMMQNVVPTLTVVGSALRSASTGSYALISGDVDAGAKIWAKGFTKGGINSIVDISDLIKNQ